MWFIILTPGTLVNIFQFKIGYTSLILHILEIEKQREYFAKSWAALLCLLGAKGTCLCPNKSLPRVIAHLKNIKKLKNLSIWIREERKRTHSCKEIQNRI